MSAVDRIPIPKKDDLIIVPAIFRGIDQGAKIVATAVAALASQMLLLPVYLQFPPISTILSDKSVLFITNYMSNPFIQIRAILLKVFPSVQGTFHHGLSQTVNLSMPFVGSILEEVVCRGIIQSVFLTEIPKMVLKKVAPKYESLVNHKIAIVARVILTSLIFALLHIVRFGLAPGMLLPQFVVGVFFSILRENKVNLMKLSGIHLTINLISLCIFGGIPGE